MRRRYLRGLSALALATAAAGCTEATLEDAERPAGAANEVYDDAQVDLPVEQSYDVVSDAIEHADGDVFEGIPQFDAFLTDEGLSVGSLDTREDAGTAILELTYVAANPEMDGTVRELGVVAGGYVRLVRGGFDGDTLEAHIHDDDGTEFGAFDVETAWARAYDADEVNARTYGGEVLHTLESR